MSTNEILIEDGGNSNTAVIQPVPRHRRMSSYSDKADSSRSRKDLDLEPPAPVMTPNPQESENLRPMLNRFGTSNYEYELQQHPHVNLSRNSSLNSASSYSEAYHLQQMQRLQELTLDDISVGNYPAPDSADRERGIHPERHSGLLNHPPSFNIEDPAASERQHEKSNLFGNYQMGRNQKENHHTESHSVQESDTSRTGEQEVGNDVNQFKRRFSWWSNH